MHSSPVLHLDAFAEYGDVILNRNCHSNWIAPVVFPHAAHSEWIDCATCHPTIFESAKGANTMAMAESMAGKQCGVCQGTVTFPVSDCKRCHYHAKDGSVRKTAAKEAHQSTKSKSGFRLPWSGRDR